MWGVGLKFEPPDEIHADCPFKPVKHCSCGSTNTVHSGGCKISSPCLWCRQLHFEDFVLKWMNEMEKSDVDVEVPDSVYGY